MNRVFKTILIDETKTQKEKERYNNKGDFT